MAKKRYTGAKVAIFSVSAAAVMYGTAWLGVHQQPAAATSTAATDSAQQPVALAATSSGAVSTAAKAPSASTAPQVTTARAKKSRAS
ncbi:MAG: hypothetical protein ABI782_07640 [Anaerolineaceae bacterium]